MNRIHLTEARNTHMDHIEDSVFLDGVKGTRQAIQYIQQMRDTLSGTTQRPMSMTVKWDGAPAIFCGLDPADDKFFVAKKGIFNQTPLIYKSAAEISGAEELPSDLKDKFLLALKHFKKLGIKNVIQGDLLFTKGDVDSQTIEDEDVLTFHPNTIVYAVPKDSTLGAQILRADIGVVWHTSYDGKDIQSLKASYGVDTKKFSTNTKVFSVDADFKDVSGSAAMTARESKEVTRILSKLGTTFRKVRAVTLNNISKNEELKIRVMAFINLKVRSGKALVAKTAAREFVVYATTYYKNLESKAKTPRGKNTVKMKSAPVMRFIANTRPAEMINIFELHSGITRAKQILIRKLNSAAFIKTFVRTSDGYKVTGEEGYVAIDHFGKKAVKLVDRLEFSFNNFSPAILKGWMSPRRG
jgi:hypothetical protein